MKAKVYFTKQITPENVIKMYDALGKKLGGNVAAKVHSGEIRAKKEIRTISALHSGSRLLNMSAVRWLNVIRLMRAHAIQPRSTNS